MKRIQHLLLLLVLFIFPVYAIAAKPGPKMTAQLVFVKAKDLPRNAPSKRTKFPITIHLKSSFVSPKLSKLPKSKIFDRHPVYVMKIMQGRRKWYWLRIGFFTNKRQANLFISKHLTGFPKAKAVNTGGQEKALSRRWAYSQTVRAKAEKSKTNKRNSAEMEAAMESARQAIAKKEYRRAVLLYTAILQSPNPGLHEQALELLGLARERNGQLAHARAEYERFLRLYPNSSATDRVRQRLAAIITARDAPKKSRKSVLTKRSKLDVFGSLSQFWRKYSNLNQGSSGINQSYVANDAELFARYRSKKLVLQSRFSGSYSESMDDTTPNRGRLYYAYVDASTGKGRLSSRFGRQTRSRGGVLGRFDGGIFSMRLASKFKLNFVGGYPAYTGSNNEIQTERFFQGVSFDLGTFAKHWDVSTFYIAQNVGTISDREAVGTEIRYFSPKQTYFTLVDYDISYNTANTIMHLANWRLTNKTGLNIVLDYRKSPTLTTSNALQGQTSQTVEELLNTLTEQQIRALAIDRTPAFSSAVLSLSHNLNKRLELSTDITVSSLSGTPASGGVAATAASGTDLYYGLRMMVNKLYSKHDVTMAGVRYMTTATRDTQSIYMNSQLRIGKIWRINGSLHVNQQQRKIDNSTIHSIEPGIRISYRMRKNVSFELDSGYEHSNESIGINGEDRKLYYFYAGYRWEFR